MQTIQQNLYLGKLLKFEKKNCKWWSIPPSNRLTNTGNLRGYNISYKITLFKDVWAVKHYASNSFQAIHPSWIPTLGYRKRVGPKKCNYICQIWIQPKFLPTKQVAIPYCMNSYRKLYLKSMCNRKENTKITSYKRLKSPKNSSQPAKLRALKAAL